MSYDLHVVRTKDWVDAAQAPITKADVDALIAADPELGWSATDGVRMKGPGDDVTFYPMITWRGETAFWWNRGEITCANPSEEHQRKIVEIARALNAYAVGDGGEHYELRQDALGREQLVTISQDV